MAIEAFRVAESVYLRLFQQQIANEAFSLDEAGLAFQTHQAMVLQNISSFRGSDDKLVADILMKWKCLYSEFRAILIRLGIGKRYVQTFQAIQEMKVGTKLNQGTLMQLAGQHKEEANRFMEERGQLVLTCLLKQSYDQIQSILQLDQLVLEYCIEREEVTKNDGENDADLMQTGVLVVVQPKEDPLIFSVDFKKALPLAEKWSKLLSSPQSHSEAKAMAEELCKLLIPPEVKILLDSTDVKHVFLCPDMSLTVLPLELLLFEDGEILGEKCTTAYLSSSRELLRDLVVVSVSVAQGMIIKSEVNEQSENDMSSRDDQADSSGETTLISQANTSDPASIGGSHAKGHSITPQVDSLQESAPEATMHKEGVIVAAPNFDLEKPTAEAESSFWESVVKGVASLFSNPEVSPTLSRPLSGAVKEAAEVRHILTKSPNPIEVRDLMNDDATIMSVLQVKSPFILHFSTHGFSYPYPRGCRNSFWDDTMSGLLLAGSNTYRKGSLTHVTPEAGTGELTSLAACGMDLQGTRLVYLSTCVSSYGLYSYGESINSLAQAFRSAGAQTVIAALWQVVDDTARHFASYFYEEACKTGVLPSQALAYAKQRTRDETAYKHWIYWSGFVCIGENRPLFPQPKS